MTALIAGQAFYNAGVVVYWLANRAAIATTLCENRDKPELECDGKCYLKKKIAEAPDNPPANDGTEFPPLRKAVEVAVTPEAAPALRLPAAMEEPAVLVPGQGRHRGLIPDKSIFHPPSFPGALVRPSVSAAFFQVSPQA
ncbi:MAG: hypothetical protein JNJ90_14260 [Saprospiraceae bacterium]|nr:hypothetical protein [Saprospiraceae bacterium]